jgi:hypothetical protein
VRWTLEVEERRSGTLTLKPNTQDKEEKLSEKISVNTEFGIGFVERGEREKER